MENENQQPKIVSKHPPELVARLYKMLEHNPLAMDFVLAYGEQAEVADDLVDEPKCVERIQKLTSLCARIYSSAYWHEHRAQLLMVELLNNLTYFVTVKWETAAEQWKRTDARALNHCAYNMLFAVLLIECGFEATKSIAQEFMESAHHNQLDDQYEVPITHQIKLAQDRANWHDGMLASMTGESQ